MKRAGWRRTACAARMRYVLLELLDMTCQLQIQGDVDRVRCRTIRYYMNRQSWQAPRESVGRIRFSSSDFGLRRTNLCQFCWQHLITIRTPCVKYITASINNPCMGGKGGMLKCKTRNGRERAALSSNHSGFGSSHALRSRLQNLQDVDPNNIKISTNVQSQVVLS